MLEFHRILKTLGRLAVVWNQRNRHHEFTANYTQIVQLASNNHPAEQRRVAVEPLLTSLLFPDVQQYTFVYRQDLDLAGLIGRAMSTSYIPRTGEVHQQLISNLQQLYEICCDRNGLVSLIYSTSVFLAQPKTLI